jgi:adenosine kinase
LKTIEEIIQAVKEILKFAQKQKTNRLQDIIVTRGEKGVIHGSQNEIFEYQAMRVAPEKVKSVNGAGDTFLGSFAAGLANGFDLKKSIELGLYCSSLSVQTVNNISDEISKRILEEQR